MRVLEWRGIDTDCPVLIVIREMCKMGEGGHYFLIKYPANLHKYDLWVMVLLKGLKDETKIFQFCLMILFLILFFLSCDFDILSETFNEGNFPFSEVSRSIFPWFVETLLLHVVNLFFDWKYKSVCFNLSKDDRKKFSVYFGRALEAQDTTGFLKNVLPADYIVYKFFCVWKMTSVLGLYTLSFISYTYVVRNHDHSLMWGWSNYSWFHIKVTWSLHSFNGDYLSIPSAHR